MPVPGFVHTPHSWLRPLLTGAAGALIAACGGTNVSASPGGGSSGGSGGLLQGTFFGVTGNSTRGFSDSLQRDAIFGVVAGDGRGFLADTQVSNNQAIFNLGVASSTGSTSVGGFFTAYAGGGSDLGDGRTQIATGNLSGSTSSSTGVLQATINFPLPSSSNGPPFSNFANLTLDTPALTPAAISAGTYSASSGPAAAATNGISTASTTFTVSFSNATDFTLSSISGCNFTGTAAADGTYDIFHLVATGSCSGTGTITLHGLASYLPKNGHSPLGGNLSSDALVLELDDADASGAHKYALALVAIKQ
jgi:hypothetical protein